MQDNNCMLADIKKTHNRGEKSGWVAGKKKPSVE